MLEQQNNLSSCCKKIIRRGLEKTLLILMTGREQIIWQNENNTGMVTFAT
jgi:hypothetical protein